VEGETAGGGEAGECARENAGRVIRGDESGDLVEALREGEFEEA
jgi:hypothetical protein